jgi:hypothetical protein
VAGLTAAACALVFLATGPPDGRSSGPFAITGRVIYSSGSLPSRVAVTIHSPTRDGSTGESVELTADGRFTASGLNAGSYVLVAAPSVDDPDDRPVGYERGFATVTIEDADVHEVVITTAPGVTVRGRIRFEESQPGSPRPDALVVHAALAAAEWMGPAESAPVAEDGTFVLHDLVGPRIFRTGWGARLRSWWAPGPVLLDGRDITNEPIYPGREPVGEVVVVFTQTPSTILGRVEDIAGLTTPGACVVLLPEDPSLRRGWSTAVDTAEADRRGRFYFSALPPGEYLVAAFEAAECPSRPEVVAQARTLARGATRVTVAQGATARVLVTTGTPPSRP